MVLNDLKNQVGEWSASNFGDNGMGEFKYLRPLLGIFEELHELDTAIFELSLYDEEVFSDSELVAQIVDAIGDTGIYMLDFCYQLGIDVPKANKASQEYQSFERLHHTVLKRIQGIRGMSDDETFFNAINESLIDLQFHLEQVAYSVDTTFEECVEKTWASVCKRNWKKNSHDGQ